MKDEFWVIKGGEFAYGPFATHEAAIASLEDWETRQDEVRIAKLFLRSETETIYKTTWRGP